MKWIIYLALYLISYDVFSIQWKVFKKAENSSVTTVISSDIPPRYQTKYLSEYNVNLVYQCNSESKAEEIYFSLLYTDDQESQPELGIDDLIGKGKYRSLFYFEPRQTSNQVKYTLEDNKFITPIDQSTFISTVLNSKKLSFYLSVSWLSVESNFVLELSDFKPYYDAARKSCAIK